MEGKILNFVTELVKAFTAGGMTTVGIVLTIIIVALLLGLNGIGGVLIWRFFKLDKTFVNRQNELEKMNKLTSQDLEKQSNDSALFRKNTTATLKVLTDTITDHTVKLNDITSLVESDHNDTTKEMKRTMLKNAKDAWIDGRDFIKKLIMENHERLTGNAEGYQKFVYQEVKKRIVETNIKIAEMADPIKMQTAKARNITNHVFTNFLSEIDFWISDELAHAEKLRFGWSSRLQSCVASYMIEWKAIYDYIYD